jgi:hypothetical protein
VYSFGALSINEHGLIAWSSVMKDIYNHFFAFWGVELHSTSGWEFVEISWTSKGNRLGEHLGTTSSAVVSWTNFRRPFQSFNNGLTKIANRRGPRHVPWGKPPLAVFHEDSWQSTLTHCWRLVKNALIQRVRTGWTFLLESFRLTFTANVKPLTKILILQLYYNSFYTSLEIY